ncbi:MAG: hypothetical protein IRZ03_08405 [Acidobacterium ailaaui]|nr:hypothetical protein [Pseudacidobacterium ailaaui]
MSDVSDRLVKSAAKAVASKNPYGIPPEFEPTGDPTDEEIKLAKDIVVVVLRELAAEIDWLACEPLANPNTYSQGVTDISDRISMWADEIEGKETATLAILRGRIDRLTAENEDLIRDIEKLSDTIADVESEREKLENKLAELKNILGQ